MPVFSTAGHVDHGKSTVLKWLTKQEPSRHKEEQRRGMTIDLGHVYTSFDNQTVGFTDVPGHTDFRLNMCRGVSAVDGFVFVVAADDGWMPQSEEHLWILTRLGLEHGCVVITKSDLVSPERVDEVRRDIENKFQSIAHGKPEIFIYENQESQNEQRRQVRERLLSTLLQFETRRPSPIMRFSPDRKIYRQGLGYIFTGYVTGTAVHKSHTLQIEPGPHKAKVRALQSYGEDREKTPPSSRAAIVLQNIHHQNVTTQSQFVSPSMIPPTDLIDCHFSPFKDFQLKKKVKKIKAVVGGSRIHVKVVGQGDSWVRLRLPDQRTILPNDRVLLMTHGEEHLIGCATVFDFLPTQKFTAVQRFVDADIHHNNFIEYKLATDGFIRQNLASTLNDSIDDPTGKQFIWASQTYQMYRDHITQQLVEAKSQEKEKLAFHQLKLPKWIPVEAYAELIDTKKFRIEGRNITLLGQKKNPYTNHPVYMTLIDKVKEKDLAPISLKAHKDPKLNSIVRALVEEGRLVRLDEFHVLGKEIFDDTCTTILDHIRKQGPTTVANIRDLLGIGRKPVLMIMETLDRLGYTTRDGDLRRLTSKAP